MIGSHWQQLLGVVLCLAGAMGAPGRSLLAGETPAAALAVPASGTALHVAAVMPKGARYSVVAPPQLVEEGVKGAIPCDQVAAPAVDGSLRNGRWRLLASIPPRPGAPRIRRFRLDWSLDAAAKGTKAFRILDVDAKSVRIDELLASGKSLPVLVYKHGMIGQKGVPARYNRACYIHPLYGVDGEIITEDFPTDHRHHRGVWWSWPHIKIGGKEYNSWIPTGIRYQHERWIVRHAGRAAAVLAAENGWYVGSKKVMREFVWIIAYPAAGGTRVVDIELTWTPLGEPITLQGAGGKSHGGLTFRYARAKDQPRSGRRKDTVITVESGVTKGDLANTHLKWADITGHAVGATGRSGCAVFCPPSHPDYPPTWLTRHYGPLCVGWPGVKPKTFPPGEPFRLRYRLWIHRGDADLATLKQAYAAYTSLDKVKWEAAGK